MKIRWTRQSLRLRPTSEELARVAAHGVITEELAPGVWRVSLRAASEAGLTVDAGALDITLSPAHIVALREDADGSACFSGSDAIQVTVEVDLPCAHPQK